MTFKVDSKTGLAEVPEEFFWRIKEDKIYMGWDNKELDVGGVQIILVRKTTEDIPETKETKWVRNSLWEMLTTFKQGKEVTTVTEAWTKNKNDQVAIISLLGMREEEPKKDVDLWKSYRVGYGYNYFTKWYKVTAPSPENLLKYSGQCWELYINTLHGQAHEMNNKRDLDKILGDYPPKTLVTA